GTQGLPRSVPRRRRPAELWDERQVLDCGRSPVKPGDRTRRSVERELGAFLGSNLKRGGTSDDDTSDRPKRRTARNAHTTDRVAAGVGGGARAVAREGESPDAGPRRARGRTPADALDGRREGVRVRRTGRQGEPG